MSCVLDLTQPPYNVVANNPGAAVANTNMINQAILDWSGTHARLVLPHGEVHLGRATAMPGPPPLRWSIYFGSGISDLALIGSGMFSTRLIVQGPGLGRDWHGILVNGAQSIELADFGIAHGTIPKPDEQTHLITVKDPSRGSPTHDIVGHHLSFGRAIGDGLRLIGDRTPVTSLRFTDFVMHLGGNARSGIALQRGWRLVEFGQFSIDGVRNSDIDLEPSGSAPMEHLNIHDALINHTGRSDVAVDLAGIHGKNPRPAAHIRLSHVTVLGGSVRMSSTQHLTISDLTVLTSPSSRRAVVNVGSGNEGVRLERLHLRRLSSGVAGNVLHVQNHDGPTTISDSTFIQETAADPVLCEESSNLNVSSSEIQFLTGKEAGSFNAIRVAAQVGSANIVSITDLRVKSRRGKLRSAVTLAARKDRQMLDVRVADIFSAGSAHTGLYISYHPDAIADRSPYMVGLDNGRDATWRQVDHNDNPTITFVCPVVGGNRHHVCQMVGQVPPENVAAAVQGSTYTFENANGTRRFVKLTGVGATGWSAPI
jgi:hypothetical protein